MVSNLEIRGAEVEIIRDYFFGGGGGESRFYSKGYDGYSILAQFAGFYSRGERGKETRVFLAQGREFRNGRDAYTLCVIVKGDARK